MTPQELLSYIRFADYVCTDSFHIMVLAIIFNVQFEVFKKDRANKKNSKNSRISDLLDRLSISNAQYQSDRDFGPKINYNSVKEKLDELREQSMNYIKNTLMTIPEVSVKAITSNYIKSADYHCSGMFHAAYQKRFYSNKNSKLDKYLLSRMKFWNFTLEEKCYFCRYLKPIERTINNRKPLFYKKLEAELYNENVPVVKIFNKYYLLYDLPFSIRNYINFDLRKEHWSVIWKNITQMKEMC